MKYSKREDGTFIASLVFKGVRLTAVGHSRPSVLRQLYYQVESQISSTALEGQHHVER